VKLDLVKGIDVKGVQREMSKKIAWVALSLLMVVALVLSSCQAETVQEKEGQTVVGQVTEKQTPAVEEEEEEVVAEEGPEMMLNVWGELVEKPRYGGSLTISTPYEYPHTDPYFGWQGVLSSSIVLECLLIGDWATPRDEFAFTTAYIPQQYLKGNLAESWETPDPLTTIFHIRQGVYWHDKPPMNGREFTAYDVEFSMSRVFGLGHGFTEPNPYDPRIQALPVESVTATDKWTVEFKYSSFSFSTFDAIAWLHWKSAIVPREVIEQNGDMRNWKTLVGTGPFMLTDKVEGTSMTYEKNPNYWATSDVFPGMKLPFADEFRLLVIPDSATQLAALRSGKIAGLGGFSADTAENLQKTNPELKLHVISQQTLAGMHPSMNSSKPPFDDIRVRQAMQMAINLDEIKEGYYKGYATTVPYGMMGEAMHGSYIPFDEWPEDVKATYTYDPEGAKQLLADAGYPDGFTFTFDITVADSDLAQLLKSYWAEIGAEAELNVQEVTTVWNRGMAGEPNMTRFGFRGENDTHFTRIASYTSENQQNWHKGNDPVFDELVEKIYAETNYDEMMKFVREADLIYSTQHWTIYTPLNASFVFSQPWLKGGWNGENGMGGPQYYTVWSRYWVDQEMMRSTK